MVVYSRHMWCGCTRSSSGLGSGGGGGDWGLGLGLVKLHKLGKIELGLLEDLDLADDDVLERENLGGSLADLLANIVGEPLEKYNQ
jgi:hypothetical protein